MWDSKPHWLLWIDNRHPRHLPYPLCSTQNVTPSDFSNPLPSPILPHYRTKR